jgi:hypothetical protein
MSRNGERKPPRPRIEMISTGASASESAAIVAAVEQFLADTAPTPTAEASAISPWARTALEEGIAARQVSGYAWGHAPRLHSPHASG